MLIVKIKDKNSNPVKQNKTISDRYTVLSRKLIAISPIAKPKVWAAASKYPAEEL